MLPVLLAFAVATWVPLPWFVLVAAAAGLALLSWRDDRSHVSARWRLLAQLVAVAAGLAVLDGGPVFQGLLPPALDLLAAGLAWVWFVNLTNFMDGIDGITGVEAASIGIGLAIVGAPAAPALIVAAAAIGFLRWNWHPARLFMGDVGSVPLGYLLGAMLLMLAKAGHWAPALILPGYYLADATWTLLRRLSRRQRVWEAHREHFYQQATQRGWSHARVAVSIGVLNLCLILLAFLALAAPWPALALAAGLIGATMLRFARAGSLRRPDVL
jgi:UDP-N-acetylmuramyl pentapeptide phosphotransferase/UDP-N-acetylglucosamine-1-phosphate transferase